MRQFSLQILTLLLLSACAAPNIPKIFYPPKPEAPRIQFLTSISTEYDLKEKGFSKQLSKQIGDKGLQIRRARAADFYNDSLYVADTTQGAILKFDFKNQKATRLENLQQNIVRPVDIAIDQQGIKYIADPTLHRIIAIDRNEKISQTYKEPLNMSPSSVNVDESYLYVTETSKNKLHIIDKQTGEVVKTYGPAIGLRWPIAAAKDKKGELLVLNMGSFSISRLTNKGELVKIVGAAGDNLGSLSRPKSFAQDRDGRIYILDTAFGNLQLFKPNGQLLMFFAQGGSRPQDLILPTKVRISYDMAPYVQRYAAPGFKIEYVIIVCSQLGVSKVNLYGFGRQEGIDYSQYDE